MRFPKQEHESRLPFPDCPRTNDACPAPGPPERDQGRIGSLRLREELKKVSED